MVLVSCSCLINCVAWSVQNSSADSTLDLTRSKYNWRSWGFSVNRRFFSSRSLLTVLLNFGSNCWRRSLTLSLSAICSAWPAGLTNWKVVAFPSCKQTCNWTLGFPSGEIFWARYEILLLGEMTRLASRQMSYLLLISEYLCDTLKLSLLPTIHPKRSVIKYNSPSFFFSLTWGTRWRMLSEVISQSSRETLA